MSPRNVIIIGSGPAGLTAALYSALQSDLLPTVPDGSVPYLILIPIAVVAALCRKFRTA